MANNLKPITIPSLLDPRLAYFCGVMAGDGNLYCGKKSEYQINCSGNPADEVEYYHSVIGPLFYSLFGFNVKLKMMDTTYGFSTGSRTLFEFLTKNVRLPAGPKHPSLHIPKIFSNDFLITNFIRGVFDTDGCMCFKKKYRSVPYYPVISCSSRTDIFIHEIADFLKSKGFRVYEFYNYKYKDDRVEGGYTIKSGVHLNGRYNFRKWMQLVGFSNPKHLKKIEEYWIDTKGDRINSKNK